jgi:hypothetical protein
MKLSVVTLLYRSAPHLEELLFIETKPRPCASVRAPYGRGGPS